MDSVFKILENNRTFGDFHTHVSMLQPMGKFNINKTNLNIFWDRYCEEIISNGKSTHPKHYGIAEKPQAILPVLVDIDLKRKCEDEKDFDKLYTDAQLESVIRDYQENLRNIIDRCEDKHLICFVFEKPAYKQTYGNTEHIKNGFHLIFPNTFLQKSDHECHLIPRVKLALKRSNVFKNLGYEDSGDVMDPSYLKNPWLMYGSKKNESSEPYKLTRIYSYDRELLPLDSVLFDYKIYDENENSIDMNENYEFYLPRVLSIVPWGRKPCELKTNLTSFVKFTQADGNTITKKEYKIRNMTEILEKCKRLLQIISDERAEVYSDWMAIGWALYNITNGSSDGLILWSEFSERCSQKYDEAVCITQWNKMEKRNITIGTLAYYAKQDNPTEYNKIAAVELFSRVKQCVMTGSHYDIAKAMYEKYGQSFVCSSIVHNTWYQFENHRWRKIDDGVFLRNKLSEDMCTKVMETVNTDFMNMDEGARALAIAEQKKAQNLCDKLKSTNFKNCVMKEMKEVFYNEKFSKLLNKDNFLLGFDNGVYDLRHNVFRQGIPEDYISLKMGVDYSEYKEEDPLIKEIEEFLEKIFPDRSIRTYFLDIMSNVFVGGNKKKIVQFWSGEGDNGKSVVESFFEKIFGEYTVKLPTALLVGKRTASSSACPELVRAAGGVRWCVLQEPDRKDVINNGILKELSGNDSFYARGLFKDGEDYDPSFSLGVICNEPPVVLGDKATWNRIRVIPFESVFCMDAPNSWEEQLRQKRFPMDPYFKEEKLPLLLKPMLWYMLNHRKKERLFIEPAKVKGATESYRKKNDIFMQFADETTVVDPKGKITLSELYINFKEWYKESVPGQPIPGKIEVKEYFTKSWGAPDTKRGGTWTGRKSLSLDEEIESGSVIVLGPTDLVH
jgi:P4 family phage/plasmid primase-like protien